MRDTKQLSGYGARTARQQNLPLKDVWIHKCIKHRHYFLARFCLVREGWCALLEQRAQAVYEFTSAHGAHVHTGHHAVITFGCFATGHAAWPFDRDKDSCVVEVLMPWVDCGPATMLDLYSRRGFDAVDPLTRGIVRTPLARPRPLIPETLPY